MRICQPALTKATVVIGLLSVVTSVSVVTPVSGQTPVEPLLQKYCLGCHNENDRQAGLSLQTFDSLKKGSDNGPVLARDDFSKSLLLSVLNKDSEQTMPPEGEAQPTDAERDRLRKWVLAGAKIKSMAAGRPEVPDVKALHQQKAGYLAVAVAPDTSKIVMGGDRFVTCSNPRDGKELWRVALPGKVSELAFSRSGSLVIAATGLPGVMGKAVLLSAENGAVVKEFTGHTDAVYAAAMTSAGTLLATAGYDRRILLHDVDSGKVIRSLEGHNGSIFSLDFDPSGKVLCSASADSTVKVWSVETGRRLDTLSQPQAEQYSVIVSNDGQRIYAGGADNRIRIWKLRSRDSVKINPQLVSRFAHEQTISRLAMSADGSLLASTAEDGSINVWTAWPLKHVQALPSQKVAVTSLAFLGNVQLYATRLDGTSEVFALDLQNSQPSPKPTAVVANAASQNKLPDQMNEVTESEGNNAPDTAQKIGLPAIISGAIQPDGGNTRDTDCFRFSASAGQELILEVDAQRSKSPLDSRIEVLDSDGRPIMRTRLQAVRDSYFTFRGKDSDTFNDFRVFNWQEMELNEYLYSDGEVVKLWLYPRGPDSGFNVYPGFGKRFTYFGTTPTSHALQAPCFIVVPRAPEEAVVANGLPAFPIYYENDDDPRRELGSDSRLHFTAPANGDYVVRLTDARGFSGPDYKYRLTVRSPRPSYTVSMNTRKLTLQPGTGREIIFTATRIDGYEGPITISAEGLPEAFDFSGPIVIQQEQLRAWGTVYATQGAREVTAEQLKGIKFTASAVDAGDKEIGGLDELKLTADPKLRIRIGATAEQAAASPQQPVTLQVRPGETIRANLQLERKGHDGVVSFGNEDSGRNLPHGVFVDNIGLNGLLLLEKQTEREFFITAAKWVPPTKVPFYLRAKTDGITSLPVLLEVVPRDAPDTASVTAATGN